MNRVNLVAAVPGAIGFLGAVGLPELSAAHWAAIGAAASGFAGALWFVVQIALAVEKRVRERRDARRSPSSR